MNRIKEFSAKIGGVNRYSLLDRLKNDCEYFLGFGNRCTEYLWAGSVSEQIWCMKVLYLLFPIDEKPEWLSMSDILSFERQMN